MHLLIPFSFIFFVLGILAGTYTPFLLFLVVIPLCYLCFYKHLEKKYYWILCFLPLGFLLSFFFPKGDSTSTSLQGFVVFRKSTYYLLWTWKGKYLVYDKENLVSLFSFVTLKGKAEKAMFSHHESGFDFASYLKSHGVYLIFTAKTTNVNLKLDYLTGFLKAWMFRFMSEKESVLSSALLFGDSLSSLDEANVIQSLGLSSILSLSGFHISFLFLLLEHVLGKEKEKYLMPCEFTFLTLFLILSGFRFALRRIFLLNLFRFINAKKKLGFSYLDRICITAFLMLVFEPYIITSPSFYYPFPLLIFFAVFQKVGSKKKWLFFVDIFLFFLPIRLCSQYEIPVISPLLQFMLIPYSHLLFLLSILLFICPLIGYLLSPLIRFFLTLTTFGKEISFSLVSGLPPIWFIILYYFLFCLIKIFDLYTFKKQKRQTGILLFSMTCLLFVPDFIPHQEIDFIDVNQGDSTLIRYHGTNVLIDTGGNLKEDLATTCLIPYFHKRKINKLDAVLITHLDYDHYGALDSLSQHFKIDRVYYGEDFLSFENQTIKIKNLSIKNLNHYQDNSDSNSSSGVFQFQLGSKKILVMGDAPTMIEQKLLKENVDVDCDILKVGHHGSNTSSSYDFIKKTSPELAIISCGYQNKYGHPHKEVINNLNSLNVAYRRTDLEGTIEIKVPWFTFPTLF